MSAAEYYNTSGGGGQPNYPHPHQPPYPQQYQHQQPQPSFFPPPQAPNQNGRPPNYSVMPDTTPPEKGETFEEKFAIEKPKYHDLWAAILFIATLLGFTAVSILSLRGYSLTKGTQGDGIYGNRADFGLNTNTVILFAFVIAIGFGISTLYLILARKFTKQFIYAMGILNIIVAIGTAVYYFARKYYSAAIVILIFGLFYAFCFWTWRPRIPFATLMLKTVIDVANKFGHVFMASAIGGLVALGFAAWFAVTLVGVYAKYSPSDNNPACQVGGGGCSKGKVVGLIVFITFAMYWTSEVIKNVLHTTVSGVYGSWYFYANSREGMPKGITKGAFRRSMTYSFGSISFGSLIVSIVQMLRQLCTIAQSEAGAEGNIVIYCLFCILRFLLDFVNWLIQFFNHYAYSYIALYGKAYVPAAKSTWHMMKDRGFDALINDLLIDPVLTAGAVFVGYLSAFLAYLYLQFTDPAYNKTGAYTPLVLAFAFLIGLQICNIFMVPLKSGVAAIFVSMAFNPEIMWRDHPELYAEIIKVYPKLELSVHP